MEFKQVWQQSNRIHGVLFDGVVILGNGLAATVHFETLPTFLAGGLLLTAVITQGAGAWLKGHYLPSRLRPMASGVAARFMGLLLFLHFLLFTVTTLLGLMLVGIYTPDHPGENGWILLALLVGGFTTVIVWGAAQPVARQEATQSAWGEYGADALLWVSVLIMTQAFWRVWYDNLNAGRGAGLSPRGITLVVALSLLFVVFYLPARYLFLVEDYQYPSTWMRVGVALLPLILAVLVG